MYLIIAYGCITEEINILVNCGTNLLMGWRNLISMVEPNMTSSRTDCIVAPLLNARILNTYTLMKLKCIYTIKGLYNITGSGQAMGR